MMASARLGADQIDELADSGDVVARNRSGEGVMHYAMERRDDGSVIPLWMMERWDLSPHEKNNDGDSPAE